MNSFAQMSPALSYLSEFADTAVFVFDCYDSSVCNKSAWHLVNLVCGVVK